jgi:hypothetical protein
MDLLKVILNEIEKQDEEQKEEGANSKQNQLDQIEGQEHDQKRSKSKFGHSFSYLPTTSGYDVRYVHLSFSSIMQILSTVKLVSYSAGRNSAEARAIFASMFQIEYDALKKQKSSAKWEFSSFSTDGETVSVLFKQNVPINQRGLRAGAQEAKPSKALVGIDPGCRSMITAHFSIDKSTPSSEYPNKQLRKYLAMRERAKEIDPTYRHKIMASYIKARQDQLIGDESEICRVKMYAERQVGAPNSNKKDLKVLILDIISRCFGISTNHVNK